MQASVRRLLCSALIMLTACVGRVTESSNLPVEPGDDAQPPAETEGKPDASDAGVDGSDARASEPPCGGRDQPLAKGLRIRELAFYQTVKVPLFQDGVWIDASNRSVTIVGGKQGIVRALVDTMPEYTEHPVRAVLRLKDRGNISEIRDQKALRGPSSEQDLQSSFNFTIKPGQIGVDTEISLVLEEPSCRAEPGYADETQVPVSGGYQALQAVGIETLRVVVVPISHNGRSPDVSPEKLEEMRTTLLAYYPVPDVEISVRAPLDWTEPVEPDDYPSWINLLNQMRRERQQDNVANHIYYVGVVQPEENMQKFCEKGCLQGLAFQARRRQAADQVALTASFPDLLNMESVAHELGHTHGREHAPCSLGSLPNRIDPDYPLKNGAVESWGWDFRTKTLVAPETHMDIMGYCEPNWISAYTYSALAERSLEVNGDAFIKGGTSEVWESILLYADGRSRWGGASEVGVLIGDAQPAEALDASGNVIEKIRVMLTPVSHSAGEVGYVPRPAASWAAIRIGTRVIQIADVLPAIQPPKKR